jgi:hypothetical protein
MLGNEYEVLGPWAEADPIPSRGINPRITDLAGKKIGLYRNGGGPGAFIAYIVGGGATPGRKEIQKIDLPKNWDRLVAKYKNVVPTYAKY